MENKLKNLIEELISLGEDEEELKFWQNIFQTFTDSEQERLLRGFKEEVVALKRTVV